MQRQNVDEWLPGAEGGRNAAWLPTGLGLLFKRVNVRELEMVTDTQHQDYPAEHSGAPAPG